jgi:hypothetical protein
MSATRRTDLGQQLESLAGRVSRDVKLADAAIVVTLTDTGDRFTVRGVGRQPSISRGEPDIASGVHVMGNSDVIEAVLSGKREASAAFAHGGIRVRGNLAHLEAVLKDLGLLQCE